MMTSKSKSKQQEALQFLDDLDSFASPAGSNPTSTQTKPGVSNTRTNNEAEVFAFIEEITQKSTEPTRQTSTHISRSGTPTLRKSTERVRLGGGPSLLPSASSSTTSLNKSTSSDGGKSKENADLPPPASTNAAGAWGWGSVWSTASAAIQQAKSAVDEQVKHLPKNEQARKWGEGVLEYAKTTQLDKLGQDFKRVGLSTLTDILNVVAPPISEHEVIQIWLSHDMQGYEGVESLVYRALARILEQVEGGDLIVNRGNESRPKEGSGTRDLNAVDGYEAALKLAQVNIETFVKNNAAATQSKPSSNVNSPTTYSHVYLRIQPFFTSFALPHAASSTEPPSRDARQHLQFLIYMYDPEHQLTHTSITQAIAANWLAIWDEYDWVEDLVAEALRIGVEVIGQEYVVSRMGWGKGDAKVEQSQSNEDSPKSEEVVEKPDDS